MIAVVAAPEQIVCDKALVITGTAFTVTFTVALTAGHGPGGSSVVNVTTAVPDEMFGVNCVVSAVGLLKVPEGELHIAEVAAPEIVPVSVTLPPAQTVAGEPAFTTAFG